MRLGADHQGVAAKAPAPLAARVDEITRRPLFRRQSFRGAASGDGGKGLEVLLAAAGDVRFPRAAAGQSADLAGQLAPCRRIDLHGCAVAALLVVGTEPYRCPPV